jgi:hypothetical protein
MRHSQHRVQPTYKHAFYLLSLLAVAAYNVTAWLVVIHYFKGLT